MVFTVGTPVQVNDPDPVQVPGKMLLQRKTMVKQMPHIKRHPQVTRLDNRPKQPERIIKVLKAEHSRSHTALFRQPLHRHRQQLLKTTQLPLVKKPESAPLSRLGMQHIGRNRQRPGQRHNPPARFSRPNPDSRIIVAQCNPQRQMHRIGQPILSTIPRQQGNISRGGQVAEAIRLKKHQLDIIHPFFQKRNIRHDICRNDIRGRTKTKRKPGGTGRIDKHRVRIKMLNRNRG